ncbi:MAG: DUF1993 domain-containing protein [Gammaproteobacteria bacterium]
MSLSMYQSLVPVAIRMLGNLAAVLEKAESDAKARNIDPAVMTGARLYPDMLPLTAQVQIATDIVSRAATRLAGKDPASVPDTESTFAELGDRIRRASKHLEAFKAEQIDGSEERSISFTVGGHDMSFNGRDYLLNFVLPNFYFHVTTAYDILRHNGVALGKRDFLGSI